VEVATEYEVIDAHVHLWRTLEQEKRALPLPGRRDRDRWGTPDAAIRLMDRCGISKLVFLNVLPTVEMVEAGLARLPAGADEEARRAAVEELRLEMADRVRRQNAWACEVGAVYERLVPFVGVQKLLGGEGGAEEVRLGHGRGAKGVKLQPGMNMFFPADRELWPVYETAQELGLAILTDSGTYGRAASDGGPYGRPVNFIEVLESFPRLTLVMAHFASAYWDERVELAGRFPNLHFDISGGFGAEDVQARDGRRALAEEDAVRVLRKVGIERFLFGTDGPSVMPQPYVEQVLRLDLTDDERRLLLADNAKRLYAL
jgi:predicted TIM-barrel fold metal-dependent hydrolase